MSIHEYKKLCNALLIIGLDDICKGGADGEDALQWVYKITKNEYIFDFDVVCRSLGIDPERIRDAIKTNTVKSLLGEFKILQRDSRRTLYSKPAKFKRARAA